MIEADKNLLRATLTLGMLSLQRKLIELYCNNLNSISISGSMVAGFAFTGISEVLPMMTKTSFSLFISFLVNACSDQVFLFKKSIMKCTSYKLDCNCIVIL